MQRHTRFTIAIAGAALAGTLALGAVADASGDDSGRSDRRGRVPRLTDEQKCEQRDRITDRSTALQLRLDGLVLTVGELRAAAETAGDTEAVERYDRQLARVERISERVDARTEHFEVWVAEHCIVE